MAIIGVTGPSGAGKSLFCSYLEDMGCLHLDCDKIYHSLVDTPSECTRELAKMFGDAILNADGSLCRPALAQIVFAPGAEESRERLNKLTHAYVLAEVRKAIAATDRKHAIVDAPLLFEAGYESECDVTVALIAPPDERLARLCARDGRPVETLRARMAAAPPDSFYTSRADFTVVNRGDTEALSAEAEKILNTLNK
ncbi:MAG: dephospho-CoA kinase [Eubacteriales bacterium]